MSAAARPETGATEQQIEESAERWWNARNGTFDLATAKAARGYDNAISYHLEDAGTWAAAFVPPTHVIALAEHVTDAADRAAIGRSTERMLELKSFHIRQYVTARRCTHKGSYTNTDQDRWMEEAIVEFHERNPSFADDLARLERLGSGEGESK